MGLLTAFIIGLVIALLWQRQKLRELKNAHLNLAAEVGVVRREAQGRDDTYRSDILSVAHREITSCREESVKLNTSIAFVDVYTKGLNERLVLLEIEKTAVPKQPDEPPPVRRSFASQKARAEAGARKG